MLISLTIISVTTSLHELLSYLGRILSHLRRNVSFLFCTLNSHPSLFCTKFEDAAFGAADAGSPKNEDFRITIDVMVLQIT